MAPTELRLEVVVIPVSDVEDARASRDRPGDGPIQPFPTFSEFFVSGLKALRSEIAGVREPVGA